MQRRRPIHASQSSTDHTDHNRGLGPRRWAALVVLMFAGACGGDALHDAGPGESREIAWRSHRVLLEADDFSIVADGVEFTAESVELDIGGDSNYADTSATLELIWQERGVEMRLFMYFESDGTDWWVNEIRTYDGKVARDWIYYYGERFRTPVGQPFEGDVDLTADSFNTFPGSLHFRNLRLHGFALPPACEAQTEPFAVELPSPSIEIPALPGFGFGATARLRGPGCSHVIDQTDLVYQWSLADEGVVEIMPGSACYEPLLSPCPDTGVDVTALAPGNTTIRVAIQQPSTATTLAEGVMSVTVTAP